MKNKILILGLFLSIGILFAVGENWGYQKITDYLNEPTVFNTIKFKKILSVNGNMKQVMDSLAIKVIVDNDSSGRTFKKIKQDRNLKTPKIKKPKQQQQEESMIETKLKFTGNP